MRRTLSTLCLALGATIALLAGTAATATSPESVTFVLDQAPSAAGTFVASGAVVDSGAHSMEIRFSGMSLHCIDTMTSTAGTIVVRLDCNLHTMNGEWRVVSGTGAYSELKANGSLVMEFFPDGSFRETLTGKAH